jgi:hypothetical protein
MLITHVLPLSETPQGFEMLAHYSGNVGKVLIDVQA